MGEQKVVRSVKGLQKVFRSVKGGGGAVKKVSASKNSQTHPFNNHFWSGSFLLKRHFIKLVVMFAYWKYFCFTRHILSGMAFYKLGWSILISNYHINLHISCWLKFTSFVLIKIYTYFVLIWNLHISWCTKRQHTHNVRCTHTNYDTHARGIHTRKG